MADPIRIHFEVEDGADLDELKPLLAKELASMEGVDEADVQQSNLRMTGVEIAAAIGAAVLVAKGAREAIDVTTDILKSLTQLVYAIKGLKVAFVETPSGPKRLEDLTDSDVAALAGS